MYIWCKDSAYRVYRHTRPEEGDASSLVLHTGRNMTVSGQLLLRDDSTVPFTVNAVTFSALPAGMKAEAYMQGYEIFNDGLPYPDLLLPVAPTEVKINATQGIWVVFRTDETAEPGTYDVLCTVSTSKADLTAHLILNVHRAKIPAPKDSAFAHEYFFDPFPDGYACKPFDEEWFTLMRRFAEEMKRLRVNSLYVPVAAFLESGASWRTGADTWELDFSKFDAVVECFLANGSFRYLTMTAPVRSVTGRTISALDENGKSFAMPIFEENTDTPTAEACAWAKALFGGIYTHCREKGWGNMLQMHLEDEPHTPESWLWAREMCEQFMPGIPCGEPIDSYGIGRALSGKCNFFVPRLEVYDNEAAFYRDRQAAGDTVWCYSCCFPEEPWWLNKFIDLPHNYSRLIHWACFSQKITGFLHWGFDFFSGKTLYGRAPGTRFKGDGYIVYPDPEHNGILSSVRGLMTTEGIEEWELLSLLSQKNRALADALAKNTARTFRDFSKDPRSVEDARAACLCALDA